ncbi:MAG: iron ABC transporter permease, partial [Spirochaetales bacterium]|nr:iron ABC transporter permease [Spirochaetales bacterium]
MPSSNNRYYLKNAVPALIIMAAVFLLPVGTVFLKAFSVPGEIGRTFTDRYTWRILLFTILESSVSALLSVVIAIPFALFFSRYTFFGRRAILTVSDAAFALPAILAVLGFVIYYGNNGVLNRLLSANFRILYSFKAIILAHVYLNFPVAFSLITSALLSSPDQEEQASRLLGASEIKTFFRITLPKMWGTVISAFTLIFLFCFPSFLIVMSLGGNPRFFTMEAEIYKRTYTDVNPASASSLSLFSFLVMTLILVISGYGRSQSRVQRKKVHLKKTSGRKKLLAFVLCLLIL